MTKDVVIRYEPEVVKCYCEKEHKTDDFLLSAPTVIDLKKLEEKAKDNHELNEITKNAKAGKLSFVDFIKARTRITKREDDHGIFSSNLDGEAESSCSCGAVLKAKVIAYVSIPVDDYEPTHEEIRKWPQPTVKDLSALMRAGELFLPEDSSQYQEIIALERQSRDYTGDSKNNALHVLDEKIKEIRKYSSVGMDYLRSLTRPVPNIDGFISNTLEALEKTQLHESFKNDVKEFFKLFKDDVEAKGLILTYKIVSKQLDDIRTQIKKVNEEILMLGNAAT